MKTCSKAKENNQLDKQLSTNVACNIKETKCLNNALLRCFVLCPIIIEITISKIISWGNYNMTFSKVLSNPIAMEDRTT